MERVTVASTLADEAGDITDGDESAVDLSASSDSGGSDSVRVVAPRLSELSLGGPLVSAACCDFTDVHSPDLSELSATRHVRHLRAAGCGVEDASAVMAATQLLSADLRDNAIKRWPRLAGRVRPRMQRLDVSRNALKSLGGIMELSFLTVLDVSRNNLTSLQGVDRLRLLRVLDASHNRLYSLQSFTEHPGLVHLEVSNNELESLAGIESLPQLTHLGAAHNRITDISSVSAATHLQRADLQRNELSDAAALEPLYGLAVLASLDLRANPATARPHYAETVLVNAAQLCWLDGERVTAEAKVKARVALGFEREARRATQRQWLPDVAWEVIG